ncbi:MAG TPA: holo-ACP synthase [bacterium]|nr:holo-ACP synthase [bacterium]
MKVGVDIVEVERIRAIIDRYHERFLEKVFTVAEQQYCDQSVNKYERYAGRFAAKEALRKALQPFTNARYLPFTHIEILPDDSGVPIPVIRTDISFMRSYTEISLSISHEKTYAVAFAIIH